MLSKYSPFNRSCTNYLCIIKECLCLNRCFVLRTYKSVSIWTTENGSWQHTHSHKKPMTVHTSTRIQNQYCIRIDPRTLWVDSWHHLCCLHHLIDFLLRFQEVINAVARNLRECTNEDQVRQCKIISCYHCHYLLLCIVQITFFTITTIKKSQIMKMRTLQNHTRTHQQLPRHHLWRFKKPLWDASHSVLSVPTKAQVEQHLHWVCLPCIQQGVNAGPVERKSPLHSQGGAFTANFILYSNFFRPIVRIERSTVLYMYGILLLSY